MSRQMGVARAAACFGLLLAAAPAQASLIVNGGFEADFTGWTVVNQPGGSGNWFVQAGTTSPTSGFPVPAPPEGVRAAMTDQTGPGSHVLYQDIFIPTGVTSATLSFQRFVGNRAGLFVNNPGGLNFNDFPNQQARVDILLASADPFSVTAGDVLQNVFQTNPGDPLVSGYTTVTADLTALLAARGGETLRLRFAEVDNQGFFQFGVDAVALDVTTTAVPAPAGLALLGTGVPVLAGLAWRRRREPVAA